MLKFFKRLTASAASRPARPSREADDSRFAPTMPSGLAPLSDLPVPEVLAEGNDHTDWSLWEDSVNALDSQMQGVMPSARIYVRETRPSQLDNFDPFSGVGKKRDV
jgi:hypothetical protein